MGDRKHFREKFAGVRNIAHIKKAKDSQNNQEGTNFQSPAGKIDEICTAEVSRKMAKTSKGKR